MTEETHISPSAPYSTAQVGIFLALAGCILFSIKPILIKIAYQYGGDATSIMTLRAFSSLPLYLVTFIFLCRSADNRSKVRQHGVKAALVGVMGYYLASFLDISSLAFISAQLERLLIFLFPTFVVLISWLIYGQKPSRNIVYSALLGYVGISLIVIHDFNSAGNAVVLGSLLAIASALVFAFYLVWSKPLITQLGSSLFTSIGMGCAGIAILVHLLVSGSEVSQWSPELIVTGIILGIFCTVLPSYLIAAAMARLTPTTLSLTSNIGPAVTAGLAIVVLDELFTVWHAIGLILVIVSVYTLNRK
ncbi:DMT family transporter [Vibrio brasiliensis]|jgi:drug/metabolite transporter (DMT)-like permease|uniref:DMT family transporter n=1 Tax=Vibrio brasiliensis TaxID=170652 RepID=UPI001EFD74EF|nr:DMT family transporter [Vibrio brasiliensis]MCG9752579.1 DMT family transporter [Vibrio brasiliensis]MCG9781910.1 DMT family transporter [Vibrio brasiliensis]